MHRSHEAKSTVSVVRQFFVRQLKYWRAWHPINTVLTVVVRTLTLGHAPNWAVSHLPRTGKVSVSVPSGREARFWTRADDWITSRVWWRGLEGFEPESIGPFLRFARYSGVVLDIGAYTGYYAILAGTESPLARIFAFEPHPRIASRLGCNIALNPHLDVTVVPYAVGDRRGPAQFHIGGPGLPSSSTVSASAPATFQTRTVAMLDIDSFVQEWALPRVDLVKIDTERAELAVITGMRDVLDRFRPVVFLEVLPGDEAPDISARFVEHGYRMYHLSRAGTHAEDQLCATCPRCSAPASVVGRNHLLCPEEKVPRWLGE